MDNNNSNDFTSIKSEPLETQEAYTLLPEEPATQPGDNPEEPIWIADDSSEDDETDDKAADSYNNSNTQPVPAVPGPSTNTSLRITSDDYYDDESIPMSLVNDQPDIDADAALAMALYEEELRALHGNNGNGHNTSTATPIRPAFNPYDTNIPEVNLPIPQLPPSRTRPASSPTPPPAPYGTTSSLGEKPAKTGFGGAQPLAPPNPPSFKKSGSSSLQDQMKEIAAARQAAWAKKVGSKKANALSGQQRASAQTLRTDAATVSKSKAQLAAIRARQNKKWRTGKEAVKRTFTLADIEELRQQERDTAAGGWIGPGSEIEKMGRRALELTNKFRKEQGLHALKWHKNLYDVAMPHSKGMAEGKVPVGHAGAQQRFASYNFRPRAGAAENVAMSQGLPDPAKVAVDGWIKSPGHRKNLLGRGFEYCAIAFAQSANGGYYSTQLFG